MDGAIANAMSPPAARAHDAIKVAIDNLKSAGVPVTVQLHLACHVLDYCLRPPERSVGAGHD
jgi:hypothetical protein